jgi:hypothetical protein
VSRKEDINWDCEDRYTEVNPYGRALLWNSAIIAETLIEILDELRNPEPIIEKVPS